MVHARLIVQRIAVAAISTLWCLAAAASAIQESQTEPSRSTEPQSDSESGVTKSTPTKPADRSKGDTGVDVDSKLKSKKKEERKPNFEIRSVRTCPSDTITYVKPNHWTLFQLDVIANNGDETVEVRSAFERLQDTPHAIQFRRLIHLLKEQDRFVRLPAFLPDGRKSKSIELALYRPGGALEIQPPGIDRTSCTILGADQFLIVPLSADPDNYRFLNGMQCVLPGSDADDDEPPERRRYYYVITQFHPTRPMVAETVLGWTTTSYAIWDDLDPGLLSKRQQDAMIDWLYCGGQLIVSGGSAATRLEQSFLSDLLPADVVGSAQLSDLSELSARYMTARSVQHDTAQMKPFQILPNKPVYFARLAPRPEAQPIEGRDKIGDLPIVVERRVGRGRIVMAAFSLYQPEFVQGWKDAYDTFWRERLFKVDESAPVSNHRIGGSSPRTYARVTGRGLSQFRLLGRDLGAGSYRRRPTGAPTIPSDELGIPFAAPDWRDDSDLESVADWRDGTPVASGARQTLLAATGIEIPPRQFVLSASIMYLVTLVPLNWLVCRFGFRRPELSWLITPVIILAFCIGIVQLARANVGFDSTSQEISVVEMFGGYPRGHVSRFTCLYSGSRERCEFRYEDPAALALPMSIGEVQRGHSIERLSLDWDMVEGEPVSMGRYEVHPRSIGMTRAEEVHTFGGAFQLRAGPAAGDWVLDNQTEWELWDCVLVLPSGAIPLGDIRAGENVQIPAGGDPQYAPARPDTIYNMHRSPDPEDSLSSIVSELGNLSPAQLLGLCRQEDLQLGLRDSAVRPRLVGWAPRPIDGQRTIPNQDRKIGFSVFVVNFDAQ